jgi:multiple sugar transport system substrate-binding protein
MRAPLLAGAVCLTAFALASCGGSGSENGRATLNLWVFNEPFGSFTDAAKRCSDASGGRYQSSWVFVFAGAAHNWPL